MSVFQQERNEAKLPLGGIFDSVFAFTVSKNDYGTPSKQLVWKWGYSKQREHTCYTHE